MNKTILILFSISLALICISGASAASLADDYDGIINQQDIIDDIGDDVTDESADAPDMIIENESEESDEIIADNSTVDDEIIEDMSSNDAIIEDATADDSAADIAETEDAIEEKHYLNSFGDDAINQLADSIVNQMTENATIPDLDVQAPEINIDMFGPTFNTALYYYAYWNAYKDYYGPFKIYDAVSAIYALVHQSYGSLETLNIVEAIFGMDPSIKIVTDYSKNEIHYPHNIY